MFKREWKGVSWLTEVGITGLAAVTAPGVRHTAGDLHSRVQGTGFGNRCYKVLIVSVSPAPPADFRLAATCNHCSIAHVSVKEVRP